VILTRFLFENKEHEYLIDLFHWIQTQIFKDT